MPGAQTPEQRAAAMNAAGLSSTQQAGVIAGTGYTPTAGGGSGATPASTTLAQDAAKAANQGKPGYDVLGNPIPGYQAPPNTVTGPDTAYSQAQKNILPSAPQTEESFYAQIQSQLAPVIDKISQAEMAAETAANVKATQATSAMNAGANSRGLAGSSEATSEAEQITQQRGADIAAALQTQAQALQSITQFAIPEAHAMYQDAITRNDAQSQAYITQQQGVMKGSLASLAASGLTLSDLKTTNPVEYNQLLQYAGGDPNNLNAMFLQASQASLLNNGQPITTMGNSLVYGVKSIDANGNPTIKAVSVYMPAGVPATYKMTVNTTTALGGVFTQYAPVAADGVSITDPTQVRSYLNGQQISGPGTPVGQTASTVNGGGQAVQAYIDGIKNGTITSIASVPAQFKSQVAIGMQQQGVSSPLADSRYTMAVNRIVSNFTALPGYQLTANGLSYLQRIQAAEQNPGSISDQDLLDSITKLNTSGNALSDAQVKVITDGRSFSDFANVAVNKLSTGGVLSDTQRKQIATLASAVYKNYQQGYQPIYDQATSQLKQAGIPSEFWTIPDLNTLYAGQTGTTAAPSGGSDNGSATSSSVTGAYANDSQANW